MTDERREEIRQALAALTHTRTEAVWAKELLAENDELRMNRSLLRPASKQATQCFCKPGQCAAPVVMDRQMPCLDPDKAKAQP